MSSDLDRLFRPRVVAVVGASEKERSQPRGQWLKVRDTLGPRGVKTIPIHPTLRSVLGTPAYRSVLDVEDDIDVAVIIVRDPLPALAECIQKGVRFAIVFSAGFGEVGSAEGDRRQAALEALRGQGMRILGPNTNLNIFEPGSERGVGRRLAILTQSGFQGRPIQQASALGIGVASWTTLGNEVDLDFADLVREYVTWDEVGAVVGYVEGFTDGASLRSAADAAAAAEVPVVVIKIGRSEAGQAAAAAHTAHVTGNDAVHDAIFRQHGIIRVDDLDDLIEVGGMFCRLGGPVALRTGGIGVFALGGGSAAHVADLFSVGGIDVPRLDDVTIKGLYQHIPPFLRVSNPVDTGGTLGGTAAGVACLELVARDPNVDVVVVPISGVVPGMSDATARDIVTVKDRGLTTPIVVIWSSPIRDDPTLQVLADAEVPVFYSVTSCVRGVQALLEWSAHVTRRMPDRAAGAATDTGAEPSANPERRRAALEILDRVPAGGTLNEVDAKELLAHYGVPTPPETLAATAEEAVALAGHGGPVALKVVSNGIPHKSDRGLVLLDVVGQEAVRDGFELIADRARKQSKDARFDGVLVTPMVTDAVAEVLVGVSRQAPFGLTVAVGLGGVFTEIFRDVALGVPPFDEACARSMVDRPRASALLHGARGRPAGDVDALVAVVMAFAQLCTELGDEIEAVEVNPLMVRPAGSGVLAVDALIERRRPPGT
jgi:acyl-CoA synthetase (NDP forming)